MGLSLAAISLAAAAEEEQAAGHTNSIRRRPVIYSRRDAEAAEIDDDGQRSLAITDLFQPPSKRGKEDAPFDATSADLFGRGRTSGVAGAAADDTEGGPRHYIVNGDDVEPNTVRRRHLATG